MNSNAPGQLLGFSLQYPRALLHILRAGPGDTVCLEVLGDVATITANDKVISEEDKSSQNTNPVTDKSTDLWKTFHNWIHMVSSDVLDVEKTKFLLYTNKFGRNSLVNLFHGVNDYDQAEKALEAAKNKLKNTNKNHAIWPFYDFVVNQNSELFKSIMCKFELEIKSRGSYDDIRKEIKKKMISEPNIEFIFKSLSGWLQSVVIKNLEAKHDAIITWDQFSHECSALFEKAQRRELIDFTLIEPPANTEIRKQLRDRPLYIKQLEEIHAHDEDIQDAVADFLRAKVNRDNWIEKEIIDEASAEDFEARLIDFWKTEKRTLGITQKNTSDTDVGMLLFLSCRARQETVRDQHPPVATIAGTYHALANTCQLGWHPKWENSFRQNLV